MSSHKNNKALKKLRRRHRLKQRRPSTFLPGSALVVRNPPGAAKMSQVLFDFVEPYMDSAQTEESLKKLITLGIVAWNAALRSPAEREELIRKTEESIPPEARQDYRSLLEPLIQRKLSRFAGNRREIFHFSLTMRPTGPYLQVVSTLPGE